MFSGRPLQTANLEHKVSRWWAQIKFSLWRKHIYQALPPPVHYDLHFVLTYLTICLASSSLPFTQQYYARVIFSSLRWHDQVASRLGPTKCKDILVWELSFCTRPYWKILFAQSNKYLVAINNTFLKMRWQSQDAGGNCILQRWILSYMKIVFIAYNNCAIYTALDNKWTNFARSERCIYVDNDS